MFLIFSLPSKYLNAQGMRRYFIQRELKAHPEWRQNGQPGESDQLVEVYDRTSGKLRAGLVVNTGAGSFRVTSAWADGDSLLLEDNRDR